MALWIPIALIAVTAAGVYSQRKPAGSNVCANQFTPEQRQNLDRFLATDPRDLLALAASKGFDKSQAVNEFHLNAAKLDALGCHTDADRVRKKAGEVSLAIPRPTAAENVMLPVAQQPSTAQQSPAKQMLQPISGSFVEPEVRVGGVAAASTQPTQHSVAPGTTARLDHAYSQAFGTPPTSAPSAPPPSPGVSANQAGPAPPIAFMHTNKRTAIRPEPIAWNDQTMGKIGFTVPASYPVGLMAYDPPACPPGWSKIELAHPDEGLVEGFTESMNLSPIQPPAAPAQARAAAPAQAPRAAPAQTSTPRTSQSAQQQRAKTKRPAR